MKIVQILIKIPAVNSEVLADLKNVESPAINLASVSTILILLVLELLPQCSIFFVYHFILLLKVTIHA
jgi:hypothetical protein